MNACMHLGSIKLAANEDKQRKHRQHPQVPWETTMASQAINCSSFPHMQSQPLFRVEYLVARSSDRCEVDSWVVACSPQYVCTCSNSVACCSRTKIRTQGEMCMDGLLRSSPHPQPQRMAQSRFSINSISKTLVTPSLACRSSRVTQVVVPTLWYL